MKSKNNDKKLNIAIICDPIEYTAGSFVSALRFAEHLKGRGHKIIFIAAKTPKSNNSDYYKEIKIYRFFSLLLPKSEKQMYLSLPCVKQVEKILKDEKIDIIHTIVPTPLSFISTKAAKSLGLKIVAASHAQPENIFLHLPKFLPLGLLNSTYYKYMYWLYNQADAVIYPSEFAQKYFSDLNKKIKVEIISNGVDINKFKKTDAKEFVKKYNLPLGKKNILYVGRFHPEKSVDTLIKAVPTIIEKEPDAQILIVGFGHLENKLKKLAADLGVCEQVIFCGKVSDDDLILAYNVCDIFVLPSLAELEGMVVLEAMACGKPLLIADSPGSASPFFVSDNGLLFKPEDAQDLAEKAIELLADKKLLAIMAENSFKKSREYDIEKSVSKLEELYYSLL